jgi:hypothetical protein
MAADKVSAYIQGLCNMERHGGRCIRMNSFSWEILDVEQWSENQQAILLSKFPRISVKVQANRKSLSGFSVLLCQEKAPHMWTSLLVCAVMMTVACTLTKSFKI